MTTTMKTFHVIRINRNASDTYAAETLEQAIDMANPDDGDIVECGTVQARDAGAARLMSPSAWALTKATNQGTKKTTTEYIAIRSMDRGTCEQLRWNPTAIGPYIVAIGGDEDDVYDRAVKRTRQDDIYVHAVVRS